MGRRPSRWHTAGVGHATATTVARSAEPAKPAIVGAPPRHDIAIRVKPLMALDDVRPETVEPANHGAVLCGPIPPTRNDFPRAAGDRVRVSVARGKSFRV